MSSSNCCFLTCIQIFQEAGQVVWYSRLLKNFPLFIVIHIVKVFGVVNKSEVDIFLGLSCFFDDSRDVGNLISGSSAFSKTSLNIWNFTVHVLLMPGLENFEHYFASMWDECNFAVASWLFVPIRGLIKLWVMKEFRLCQPIDDFELKASEKQTQEKLSVLHYLLKTGHKCPLWKCLSLLYQRRKHNPLSPILIQERADQPCWCSEKQCHSWGTEMSFTDKTYLTLAIH